MLIWSGKNYWHGQGKSWNLILHKEWDPCCCSYDCFYHHYHHDHHCHHDYYYCHKIAGCAGLSVSDALLWLAVACVQDMQSRMPSDPIEAELLMMAEAVASGGRESDSESEVSDDDNCKTPHSSCQM